jgi:hypothetical protein
MDRRQHHIKWHPEYCTGPELQEWLWCSCVTRLPHLAASWLLLSLSLDTRCSHYWDLDWIHLQRWELQVLYNFIQFGSHTSRTPCAAMNFGLGHGSQCPVSNVKCVTLGPNLRWRCKKGNEIFCLECQIFGGVIPKVVGCRSAKSIFWVMGHNLCRIEWNCTVR